MNGNRTRSKPSNLLLIVLLVLCAWSRSAGAEPQLDLQVRQTMEEWLAPGAVVVIVADGRLVHARGYGVADQRTATPVDVDETVFRVGSISKPVTATAALRLQQMGRLDLTTPVQQYLDTDLETGAVTLAHLLTHTAGFEDRLLNRLSERADHLPDLDDYLAAELPRRIYPPGHVSIYSNHGIALAGLVIAEIMDRPFPEAMDQLLFEPLAMRRSSFVITPAVRRALAQGHRDGEPVSPAGIKTVPASMLATTGGDMARLMLALVAPEQSGLLTCETAALLFARQFEHHPQLTGRAYGWSEDSSVTPRRLYHSGAVEGFSSGIVLVPERQGGIFVSFNGNAYVWQLMAALLESYFPATPRPPTAQVSVDLQAGVPLAELAGRYAPAMLARSSFDKARLLFEQTVFEHDPSGQLVAGRWRYRPAADGTLRAADGRLLVPRPATAAAPILLLGEGVSLRRLAWHEAWPWHGAAMLGFVACFARLARGRWLAETGTSVRQLLAVAGALDLLFVLGVGVLFAIAMSQDGGVLRYRAPWYLVVLLFLPLVAGLLSVASLGIGIYQFRRYGWSAATLRRGLTALIGLLLFLPFLAYWNLLGFRF